MAILLNDLELKKLVGTVIFNGDIGCIRPNSYIIRLGNTGEFINSGKEFNLGKEKKGIIVQPGHSVALTAYETLDFRRETVRKIFPDSDLHAFISPTTDLSREGLVAPTTQVDAGYNGTLNWTITNTSSDERRFLFQEKIFKLTIFKLEKGEKPDKLYDGDYQEQLGYVRSKRKGPPVGMKSSEWEDSVIKDGPEVILDNLIKSGYPWNLLGQRLKAIDQQFKTVSDEYSDIDDSIRKLTSEIDTIKNQQNEFRVSIPKSIKDLLKDETSALQNRWLIGVASLLVTFMGLVLAIMTNITVKDFFKQKGAFISVLLILIGGIALYFINRNKKKTT